jgi:outer membrane PBP1 activator LpoA protein
MSLSQEAEAAAAARHAAASGFERAVVLAPESAWGERLTAAFEAEFLQDDRQIVGAARYVESQNDHSSVLERVLKLDASEARKRLLENTLQMPLEFEPARREDVDVIFLAASSMQAKLIRPQLRFLDAGDIPVYATGRVFSGQPDPAGNQDLDGLRFPALPWQLKHTDEESIPDLASLRGGALSALFAIGQDAWNVLPWLDLMRSDGDFAFPGASGIYRMGRDGGLIREPAWAEFSGGVPRRLPSPAAPASLSRPGPGRM